MGEIQGNWQRAKFYCSEIKLIYSTGFYMLGIYSKEFSLHIIFVIEYGLHEELTPAKLHNRDLVITV